MRNYSQWKNQLFLELVFYHIRIGWRRLANWRTNWAFTLSDSWWRRKKLDNLIRTDSMTMVEHWSGIDMRAQVGSHFQSAELFPNNQQRVEDIFHFHLSFLLLCAFASFSIISSIQTHERDGKLCEEFDRVVRNLLQSLPSRRWKWIKIDHCHVITFYWGENENTTHVRTLNSSQWKQWTWIMNFQFLLSSSFTPTCCWDFFDFFLRKAWINWNWKRFLSEFLISWLFCWCFPTLRIYCSLSSSRLETILSCRIGLPFTNRPAVLEYG